MRRLAYFVIVTTATFLIAGATAYGAKAKAYTDAAVAAKEDTDFNFQGEYVGQVEYDGQKHKVGAQLIALGDGKFQGVRYMGGLPGAGWDGKDKKQAEGTRSGDTVTITTEDHVATFKGGVITVKNKDGAVVGTLKKIERKSPTLGAKPPKGAVVLFDGTKASLEKGWKKGARITDDGLLMQGCMSKQRFGDFTLHIEFRLPYMPTARGQGRGNSGIYMQGRHEVQMLDSFGLAGKNNECGGIYSVKAPDVNMCLPPLSWQTYDIEFIAARFDVNGKKTANARMTVKHNGVVVHKGVEVPKATTAARVKEGADPGPIYLQDHGTPVRYRNIWVVPKSGGQ